MNVFSPTLDSCLSCLMQSITENEDGKYTKNNYYAILTIIPVFKYLHL